MNLSYCALVFSSFFSIGMGILPACVFMYHKGWCQQKPEKTSGYSGTGVTDGFVKSHIGAGN